MKFAHLKILSYSWAVRSKKKFYMSSKGSKNEIQRWSILRRTLHMNARNHFAVSYSVLVMQAEPFLTINLELLVYSEVKWNIINKKMFFYDYGQKYNLVTCYFDTGHLLSKNKPARQWRRSQKHRMWATGRRGSYDSVPEGTRQGRVKKGNIEKKEGWECLKDRTITFSL